MVHHVEAGPVFGHRRDRWRSGPLTDRVGGRPPVQPGGGEGELQVKGGHCARRVPGWARFAGWGPIGSTGWSTSNVSPRRSVRRCLRTECLAGRRHVRAVPQRSFLGERELAGVLRRLRRPRVATAAPASAGAPLPGNGTTAPPTGPDGHRRPAGQQRCPTTNGAPAPAPVAVVEAPAPAPVVESTPAVTPTPAPTPTPSPAPSAAPAIERRSVAGPLRERRPGSRSTWRRRWRFPRRPACARCRPSCSRSTGPSESAPGPDVGSQGELHPPHRLRRGAGPAGRARPQRLVRRRTIDGKGTAGVVRHEHVGLGLAVDVSKRRRHPDAARPRRPRRRESRLPRLRRRLRGPGAQGPHRQGHARRLRRRDGDPHQPGHARHGAVGAPAHAGPGGHHRGRARWASRPSIRRPTRRSLAALGVGPVVTLTSTYDHRIIQGAESGMFLTYMAECLTGQHGFYDDVFAAMDVPYEPVRWQADVNAVDSEHQRLVKQVHVQSLINMYRVRGHLIADLDPLSAEPCAPPRRARPHHLRPHAVGPRPGIRGRRPGRTATRCGSARRSTSCATPTAARSAIEYMHIQDPEQKRWIQHHVEGRPRHPLAGRAAPHPRPAERGRGLRAFPPHPLRRARSASASKGRSRPSCFSTPSSTRRPQPGSTEAVLGHGPPGPAERPRQHRGQVLRRDLPGVRGRPRPRVGPGLG